MSYAGRRVLAQVGALSAVAGACLLWRFPPAQSGFYPRCPVFLFLHIQCPGCGGTRAVAALLHGRLGEALHWNALLVILLPWIAVFLAASYWRALRRDEFAWPQVPEPLLQACLVLVSAFTIVRNLHGL